MSTPFTKGDTQERQQAFGTINPERTETVQTLFNQVLFAKAHSAFRALEPNSFSGSAARADPERGRSDTSALPDSATSPCPGPAPGDRGCLRELGGLRALSRHRRISSAPPVPRGVRGHGGHPLPASPAASPRDPASPTGHCCLLLRTATGPAPPSPPGTYCPCAPRTAPCRPPAPGAAP